jgi:hypothetical protein
MKANCRFPYMNTFAKLLCFFLLPFFTQAQNTKETKQIQEKSKIENFSLKKGILIKKDFAMLGTVKKIEVQALKLTDVITGVTISGIKLKTSGHSERVCFLDADEVDGFLKSGKYLLKSLKPSDNYVEYQFTSRDGFQTGACQKKDERSYYLKLEKQDNDSYVFLEEADFERLINMVAKAKVK